jgi:hypothetical protein
MKRLDGYLSRKMQTIFPAALVYCDASGPVEIWTLEFGDASTQGLDLGGSFNAAKQAVDALVKAERSKKGRS